MTAQPNPMPEEVLSIAVFKAAPGKVAEAVQVLRELDAKLRAKGYSHDVLYEEEARPGRFVLLRYWRSIERRTEAHQDVEMHDYWQKLASLIQVEEVFERLVPPQDSE